MSKVPDPWVALVRLVLSVRWPRSKVKAESYDAAVSALRDRERVEGARADLPLMGVESFVSSDPAKSDN